MNRSTVVLVTGGTKGIGLAIANRFANEDGHIVIACARNPPTMGQLDKRVKFFQCDVGDRNQIKAMAESINSHHGAVSVLVNNAGKFIPGRIQDESDSTLDTLLVSP